MSTTAILSPSIATAVQISTRYGNAVAEITDGWAKVVQVVQMRSPMESAARVAIHEALPMLRYWTIDATPHNAAQEGFTCDASRVALAFPREVR
jgi:hypothetical protein